MTPSKYLKLARDHIDEYGWRKGAFGQKYGPTCAVGALDIVAIGGSSVYVAGYRYLKVAAGYLPAQYNDEVCKTKQDCLDWYNRAIALAEEDEYGENTSDGMGFQRDVQSERCLVESPR